MNQGYSSTEAREGALDELMVMAIMEKYEEEEKKMMHYVANISGWSLRKLHEYAINAKAIGIMQDLFVEVKQGQAWLCRR